MHSRRGTSAALRLLYSTSAVYVPDEYIDKVDKDIVKFIWNNKPPKIKTANMIGNIEEGGLKMPKFSILIQSQKILWIKRWLTQEYINNWPELAKNITNMKTEQLI